MDDFTLCKDFTDAKVGMFVLDLFLGQARSIVFERTFLKNLLLREKEGGGYNPPPMLRACRNGIHQQ